MTRMTEQKLTVDLPTLLMDAEGQKLGTTHPGLEAFGYFAVPGELEFAVTVDSEPGDPSQVKMTLRLLSAHYSPPADCPPRALATVNRVNAALATRLTGDV